MIRATPAEIGGREAPPVSLTQSQVAAAAYDDPTPSPAWMRLYYICGCGFECVVQTNDPFKFTKIPHRCLR